MEKAQVLTLLEKYWQAETTIAEEQALAAYFQGGQVDPELLVYSDLFAYFREEAQITAGPGFGDRILQRLGMPLEEETPPLPARKPFDPAVLPTRKSFGLGVLAAAAAILAMVAGLYLLTPAGRPTILASNDTAVKRPEKMIVAPEARFPDTYDDPEKALAAVRHALLIASNHLNQGRRRITGANK